MTSGGAVVLTATRSFVPCTGPGLSQRRRIVDPNRDYVVDVVGKVMGEGTVPYISFPLLQMQLLTPQTHKLEGQ